MIKRDYLEEVAELFDWIKIKPYLGEPVWCRDDQVIHSDEDLLEEINKEIKEYKKKIIQLQQENYQLKQKLITRNQIKQ